MTDGPAREGKTRALAFLKAGSSALVSQVAALLLLPFLFRIYSPEDFGLWATLQAVVLTTASLSILRYDLAIVTEPDGDRAGVIFWGCVALGLVVATVSGGLGMLWAVGADASLWDGGTLALCGAWLMAAVLNQPLQSWLVRDGRFGASAASIVMATAGANLGQLLMASWHADHRGLIAGSAMGSTAGVLLAIFLCRSAAPRFGRLAGLRETLTAHRRFVFFSLPFTVLSLARERAPVLILAAFGPAVQVGAYSQAWRLVHIPAGLASSALRPVVFHAAARGGAASVGGLIQQLVSGMGLLAAPWLGVVLAEPALLFGLVLGEAWREAGVYAAMLAAPALLFMLTNWLDRLLDVARRQDANLKLEVLASILSVGGFAAVLWVGATLSTATLVQSAALVVSYLAVLLVAYRICGYPLAPLVRTLGVATAFSGATWAVTFGAASLLGGLGGLAIGAVLAAALSGAIALRRLRPILAAIAGAK